MLLHAKLENKMRGFAILTAAYLFNRSPTTTVETTPAEKWYGKKPNLSNLREFGQVVYTKKLGYLKKLQDRSDKGIFVGYAPNGYRVWNPVTRKIYVSRDIKFTNQFEENEKYQGVSIEIESLQKFEEEYQDDENRDNHEHEIPRNIEENYEEERNVQRNEEIQRNDEERRPRRERRQPTKYQDYKMDFQSEEEDEVHITILPGENEALMTYEEAIKSPEKHAWQKAIQEEKDSLMKNKTWTYVDADQVKGKEILTSRWIFKVKDNGIHKARLVVRGCSQNKIDMDYENIFSPVVNTTTLRLLFAIAARRNWNIQTLDIKTAFLYAELDEPIYMKIPDGYNQPGKVCVLQKSLYGLRQAPCQWNKRFTNSLKQLGMTQLKSDPCLFKSEDGKIYLAIHVDDGIIIGEDKGKIKQLQEKLKYEFQMIVNEEPKSYLGIDIERTEGGIIISQEKYAKKVLNKFKMNEAKHNSNYPRYFQE